MKPNKLKHMERIDPARLAENFIELIGREWMLVTAGSPEKFNTMTASWGGAGFLWNRPVAFVFVRPERYALLFGTWRQGGLSYLRLEIGPSDR